MDEDTNTTMHTNCEVIPPDGQTRFCAPRIVINRDSTIGSPCFWMLLGVGITFGAMYLYQNGGKVSRKSGY